MTQIEPLKDGLAGATKDIKGKLIEFAWNLKREGLGYETIKTYTKFLMMLEKKGARLLDPDSVTDVLATQEHWKDTTKAIAAASYQKFAKFNGTPWRAPKLRPRQRLPFIPLESEIDSLVAFCGKKTATVLQTLKETGMRIGEAVKLSWTDLDFERNTITLNETEKCGKPRMFKISSKLAAMLNVLPRKGEKVFELSHSTRSSFWKQRKNAARKLQNPRLLRISFHTFRHWKATMEYHKTKDILHVKEMLGHRSLNNTLVYTQLVTFESDDYHSATAKTVEEAKQLVEAGFEYVCDVENCKLFRKRK